MTAPVAVPVCLQDTTHLNKSFSHKKQSESPSQAPSIPVVHSSSAGTDSEENIPARPDPIILTSHYRIRIQPVQHSRHKKIVREKSYHSDTSSQRRPSKENIRSKTDQTPSYQGHNNIRLITDRYDTDVL